MSTPVAYTTSPMPPPHLSRRQVDQLRKQLEGELRWLTGAEALEWLSLPSETIAIRAQGGQRMYHRLNQIQDALDRIKTGTYGTCSGCRQAIPFERLDVIPETPTCIECGRN